MVLIITLKSSFAYISRSVGTVSRFSTTAKTSYPLFHKPRMISLGEELGWGPLVSAEQAKSAFESFPDRIRFVDASWHMGGVRKGKEEYLERHLPKAVFFDIDKVSDTSVPLPHMLPSAELFGTEMSSLGLDSNHTIIVYTTENCFSGPRGWWTFRTFGHEAVHLLNGGINAWIAHEGKIESGDVSVTTSRPTGLIQAAGNAYLLRDKGFRSNLQPHMVRTWRQVLETSSAGSSSEDQVIDARSMGRFTGQEPEPRAGLQGGHIPNSICIPFPELLQPGDWCTFKSTDELRTVFESAGVNINSDNVITTSCGSGVTAAILTLALQLLGRNIDKTPIYDGSWSEWGGRNDLPKSKGDEA